MIGETMCSARKKDNGTRLEYKNNNDICSPEAVEDRKKEVIKQKERVVRSLYNDCEGRRKTTIASARRRSSHAQASHSASCSLLSAG